MAIRSTICVVILLGAAVLRGGERRELQLVWVDAHGLFPDFERVHSEADVIFRDLGVDVCWEVGSDPRRSDAGERRIQVVLMPSEPSGWGISPNAMGVVLIPASAQQDSVYLFYRPILRNIGLGRRGGAMLNPRERRDTARAIARVLIHEVVHAIAPNLSHADEGVMHDSLLMGALSNRGIEIDDRTREELLRGLAE
jgi:hypothetical protein